MNNLQEIIVGLSVVVLIISTWAIYYFIGRIIVTRGRWENEKYPEHLREMIYKNNPEVTTPPRDKKLRS